MNVGPVGRSQNHHICEFIGHAGVIASSPCNMRRPVGYTDRSMPTQVGKVTIRELRWQNCNHSFCSFPRRNVESSNRKGLG